MSGTRARARKDGGGAAADVAALATCVRGTGREEAAAAGITQVAEAGECCAARNNDGNGEGTGALLLDLKIV